MFVPFESRGRGEGGGGFGGQRVEIVLITKAIPIINEDVYRGGKRGILLVKVSKNLNQFPQIERVLIAASEEIARICSIDKSKTLNALTESMNAGQRKYLRDGTPDYIEKLQKILSEVYNQEVIEFSVENV